MLDSLQPIISTLPFLLSIFGLVIVATLVKGLLLRKMTGSAVLPYIKADSVMTPAEQKYFRKLETEYGQTHYIFPQVKLDKIINTTDQKNFYTYWNKINKKSIDFVLVDKQTLQTIQLIELNDYTHNRQNRIDRDVFLKRVCEKAGIPLKIV